MNKGKLIEVIGDVTTPQRIDENEIVIIAHCCNNKNKWGAGVVLAISKKWKKPEEVYRNFCERNKNISILGRVCYAKIDDNLIIANMIGQDGVFSKDNLIPIKYRALANCMSKIAVFVEVEKIKTNKNVVIHAPKFGSNLAKGNWSFVLELIREIWLENNISVVIYEYVG